MPRKAEKMTIIDAEVEAKLAEINELRNHIERLDAIFDRNMEKVGLTEEDLRKLELTNLPPDIKKIVDETRREAQKAGEQVARDLSFQNSNSPRRSFSRAGALKL
jgi:ribosomal protein L16 Arg81 hydroxylase